MHNDRSETAYRARDFERFWMVRLVVALLAAAVLFSCLLAPLADAESGPEERVQVDANDLSLAEGLGGDVKNILLLGTDARLESSENSLTDTIMIVSIHQDTGVIKLVSIMRDTWVSIPGYIRGAKINAANKIGGPNLAMKAVNELFGLNIDDYVLVSMNALVMLVDSLGGIEIDVREEELTYLNINLDGYKGDLLEAGESVDENAFAYLKEYGEKVHVNGQQALAYARIRTMDSDYVRTERQRYILTVIAEKVASGNLIQLATIGTRMFSYINTSMSFPEMLSMAGVLWKLDMGGFEQLRLPADGTFTEENYNLRPDFEQNAAILREFLYGA